MNRTEVPYDRKPGEAPRLDDSEIDAVVTFLRTLTDGYGESLALYADPEESKSLAKADAMAAKPNLSATSGAVPAPSADSTRRRRQ